MADDGTDALMAMQGRMLAIEGMLIQTIWKWAETQPHPPTALASWMRPIEEQFRAMQNDPGNHPAAMTAAVETVQGICLELEATLQRAALLRATPAGSGKA